MVSFLSTCSELQHTCWVFCVFVCLLFSLINVGKNCRMNSNSLRNKYQNSKKLSLSLTRMEMAPSLQKSWA